MIELPCFKNSIEEMTQFISENKIDVRGKLVAYHAAGDFLPEVKSYMTESAHKYNTVGGGKGLIDQFTGAFGDAFDSTITGDGTRIGAGKLTIADIDMVINPDSDAYEVEIPDAKAVYMHMLGHDCHSIVAGAGHADAIISNLRGYLDRGFELFLSAHYGPETRKDVETKIAYLEMLKKTAAESTSAQEFKQKVEAACPGYSGQNYLDMTVGFFFPSSETPSPGRPGAFLPYYRLYCNPESSTGTLWPQTYRDRKSSETNPGNQIIYLVTIAD